MAYHSIIIRPKHGVFDRDVLEKAKDLVFLWHNEVTWYFSLEQIVACYRGWFFDLEEEVLQALRGNHVTQGMVDFYKWVCAHGDVRSDCWNANDNEYGPWDVKDFIRKIQTAVCRANEWEGPVPLEAVVTSDCKIVFATFLPEEHLIQFDYREYMPEYDQMISFLIHIKVPETVAVIRDLVIKDDKLYIFDSQSKNPYEIDLKECANYCEQMDITELLKYMHMIQSATVTLAIYE